MGLFLGSEILAVQNSGMSFYLSVTSALHRCWRKQGILVDTAREYHGFRKRACFDADSNNIIVQRAFVSQRPCHEAPDVLEW